MKNSFKKYFNRWIYVFLMCLWPIMNYFARNFETSHIGGALFLIFLALFFVSILFIEILDHFFKKGPDHYLFFIFSVFVLFFTFGKVLNSFENSYVKPAYLWVVFVGLLLFLSWKLSSLRVIQKIVKLIIIALVTFPLILLSWGGIFNKKKPSISRSQNITFDMTYKPNIYYILMDAYGRQDTLKEVMEYDNEPFLKALEHRGFIVSREAYSNYHFTISSLSATMNMRYHDLPYTLPPMFRSLEGDNNVRRILKRNGYKIINVPSYWQHIRSIQYQDASIEGRSFDVAQSFFSETPLKIISWPHHYVDERDVEESVRLFPNEPKFVFVHLAHVHDALKLRRSLASALSPFSSSPSDKKRYYRESIEMMNHTLLRMIDSIQKQDPQSVIVLQSDHGPLYVGEVKFLGSAAQEGFPVTYKKQLRYKFGIMSAIYLPDYDSFSKKSVREYLSGKSTLINTFRCIFTYLNGKMPLTLEKDASYFIYKGNLFS